MMLWIVTVAIWWASLGLFAGLYLGLRMADLEAQEQTADLLDEIDILENRVQNEKMFARFLMDQFGIADEVVIDYNEA